MGYYRTTNTTVCGFDFTVPLTEQLNNDVTVAVGRAESSHPPVAHPAERLSFLLARRHRIRNRTGKTTTLRMLLGLAEPTRGGAEIDGIRYAQIEDPALRVGAVLEASGAHEGRTARDHLRVLCRAAGLPGARADEVLATVGLARAGGRRVRAYSLGMRQRLGVAAALLGDPQVLILDEPGNGLDPAGIRWTRSFLRSLAASGRTVLVSSHQPARGDRAASRRPRGHRRRAGRGVRAAAVSGRAPAGLEEAFLALTTGTEGIR